MRTRARGQQAEEFRAQALVPAQATRDEWRQEQNRCVGQQAGNRNGHNHLPTRRCESQDSSRLKELMVLWEGGVGGGIGTDCLDIFVGVWASRGGGWTASGRKTRMVR